jgi:hypothetical protein
MKRLYFILYFLIISFSVFAQQVIVVSSFTLVNSVTEQDIFFIENGDTIGHPEITSNYYYINVRANTLDEVGSVVFNLDGNYFKTDNESPYALAGDHSGDYSTWHPKIGQHILTATPYSGSNGTGVTGQPLTIYFTVIAADKISDFTLVNSETDQDIIQLSDGGTLNLSMLPTDKLNIRANANVDHFGSVVFALNDNDNFHIENIAPFALTGHVNGNYNEWIPTAGNYMLSAVPYYGSNGTGEFAGKALTINFTVVNDFTISGNFKKSDIGMMEVYPNPASSEITVSIPDIRQTTTIEMTDVYGKKFYEESQHEPNLNIDLNGLQPGLYFINLRSLNNIEQVVKFIKN